MFTPRNIALVLAALLSQFLFAGNNNFLFSNITDKDVRADSIYQWTQREYNDHDSGYVFSRVYPLLQQARQKKDGVAEAGILQAMATYTAYFLHNYPQGEKLYLQAIKTVGESQMDLTRAIYLHRLGVTCLYSNRYSTMLEYVLRAEEIFEKMGLDKNRYAGWFQYDLALIYYHFGDYETCLKYANRALLFKSDSRSNQQQLNTIALCYRNLSKYDSALIFFDKNLQFSRQIKDTAWIGISSGNIGSIYIRQKEYAKARPYCEIEYACYLMPQNRESAVGALTKLADINVALGKPGYAVVQLKEAEKVMQTILPYEYERQQYLYETMERACASEKNYAEAYRYSLIAKGIADSVEIATSAMRYAKVHLQVETEKHLSELKVLESQKQAEITKRNFSLAGIFLIAVVAVQVYSRQRLKRRKEFELYQKNEELLKSENLRIEEELRNSESLLNSYIDSLRQKSSLIEQFQSEIQLLQSKPDSPVQLERVETLDKLQRSTILTEDDWTNFKEVFEKVHKGFFIRLKEKYADLTQAETRLLALTKLNLATKEMAAMLGISVDSVKKARQRLRKKLNLPEEGALNDVLAVI